MDRANQVAIGFICALIWAGFGIMAFGISLGSGQNNPLILGTLSLVSGTLAVWIFLQMIRPNHK